MLSTSSQAIHLLTSIFCAKDREEDEYYNITINATNGKALPFQIKSKVFTVHVLDLNDNAPHIIKSSLSGKVSEAASIGTEIIKLSGNDLDLVSALDFLGLQIFTIKSQIIPSTFLRLFGVAYFHAIEADLIFSRLIQPELFVFNYKFFIINYGL